MSRRLTFVLLSLALLATASCLDDSITGIRTLTFALSVTPSTANVGQSVNVDYTGTGTQIRLVIIDFGDGVADTITYVNPVEVSNRVPHTYTATGAYTISGLLVSGSGNTTDQAQVSIN